MWPRPRTCAQAAPGHMALPPGANQIILQGGLPQAHAAASLCPAAARQPHPARRPAPMRQPAPGCATSHLRKACPGAATACAARPRPCPGPAHMGQPRPARRPSAAGSGMPQARPGHAMPCARAVRRISPCASQCARLCPLGACGGAPAWRHGASGIDMTASASSPARPHNRASPGPSPGPGMGHRRAARPAPRRISQARGQGGLHPWPCRPSAIRCRSSASACQRRLAGAGRRQAKNGFFAHPYSKFAIDS